MHPAQNALLGTGFPFRIFTHLDAYMAILKDFTQRTAGIRRLGSASLDLAYVTSGRLDGFWEFGLSAAGHCGCLLITEAGGWLATCLAEKTILKPEI